MKISIDVDGVLAQFTAGFVRVVNDLWPGKLPLDYEPTEWHSVLTEAEVSEVWRVIKDTENFFAYLPPYVENVECLFAFLFARPPGLDVYFVTSRIVTRGASPMKQTQDFLHRVGIPLCGTSVVIKPPNITKLEIYHALGIEWSIDDYHRNIPDPTNPIHHSFYGDDHNHYLLARPWNAEFRGRHPQVPVVENLEAFLGKVLASGRAAKLP